MNLLDKPAQKLFISQCLKLTPEDSNKHETQKSRYWNFVFKTRVFSVRLVWIQGIIVNVTKLPEITFQLDDGTGIASVMSASEAPGYSSTISNGQYAMVIGEVLSNQPSLEVRTLKLTRLPESDAESIWNFEVQDFWKFLLS